MIHELTLSEFPSLVMSSENPVLVDFHATWCGPCKRQTPLLENLKLEMGDALSIVKVDVDREQELAAAFQIRSIPALLLFKNGKLRKRFVGLTDTSAIKSALVSTELHLSASSPENKK